MPKLYEIKLPAKVYCEVSDGSKFVTVRRLDGAYSFGKTDKTEKNPEGTLVYLSASTPLKAFKDGYKIEET